MLVRRRAYLRRKPSQDRSSFTFEAILDAAELVILAHGVEGLQMAGLGRRAGVSNGTLYQYFPDRLSVLMALSDRSFARFTEELRRLVKRLRGTGVIEFLEQLAVGVVDAALRDHRLRVALRETMDSRAVGERVDVSDRFAEVLERELTRRSTLGADQLQRVSRSLVWLADGLLEGALRDEQVSSREVSDALLLAWRGVTGELRAETQGNEGASP